jgi:thiol-disulfide isomerase/thioredoxin
MRLSDRRTKLSGGLRMISARTLGIPLAVASLTLLLSGARSSPVRASIQAEGSATDAAHIGIPDALTPAAQRSAVPDFTLTDANGKPVTLSAYKGKVVLLDFWATWCGGCKIEIPWYMEFDKKYRDQGLAVLGVSMDKEGWAAVKPFLAKKTDDETGGSMAMEYPIVIGTDDIARAYNLKTLPVTLLLDRDGKIAVMHTGLVNKESFENNIRSLLK